MRSPSYDLTSSQRARRPLILSVLPLALVAFPSGESARAQTPQDGLWALGNCNLDQRFDVADAIAALDYLFAGSPRVPCVPLCDVTGDGRLNIADPISVLSYLFNGMPLPNATTPPRDERCDGLDNDCNGLTDDDCSPAGMAAVDLAWDPVTLDIRGNPEEPVTYRIYIGRQSRQYTDVRNIGAATDFRVYGLTAGVSYYLALTALDRSGNESGYSNEITAVPEVASP